MRFRGSSGFSRSEMNSGRGTSRLQISKRNSLTSPTSSQAHNQRSSNPRSIKEEQHSQSNSPVSRDFSNANSSRISGSEQRWQDAPSSGVGSEEFFIQTSFPLMELIQAIWKGSRRAWDV